MAKFKITKDDSKKAELYQTVVSEPMWMPLLCKIYQKAKADDGSDLHKFQFTVMAVGNPDIDRYAGLTLFTQYSEKALGFMGPFLAAVGCEQDDEGNFELEDMKDLVEQKVDGYVIPDIYKQKSGSEKKQNRLEDFRPFSNW